jgi:hypothetical protein
MPLGLCVIDSPLTYRSNKYEEVVERLKQANNAIRVYFLHRTLHDSYQSCIKTLQIIISFSAEQYHARLRTT